MNTHHKRFGYLIFTALLLLGLTPWVSQPLTAQDKVKTTSWNITGNAGTNPSQHFLGTTDAQPLIFRTNGVERARFTGTSQFISQVGISTPEAQAAIFSYILESGHRITVKGNGGTNESGLQHDFPSPNLKIEFVGKDAMGNNVGYRQIYERLFGNADDVRLFSVVPGSSLGVETDRFDARKSITLHDLPTGNRVSSFLTDEMCPTLNYVFTAPPCSGLGDLCKKYVAVDSQGNTLGGYAETFALVGNTFQVQTIPARIPLFKATPNIMLLPNNLNVANNATCLNMTASSSVSANTVGASIGSLSKVFASEIFTGNLTVFGSKTGFKIDHPLDPANKYLVHAPAESPEPVNLYRGNVALDENGEAWVKLPDYFEALNRDFHYQLTCVGGFAPVYVAEEIKDNRFKIAGGKPGLKVSWTVTGVRNDAYAKANPMQVEQDKPENERGKYLFPELYGKPQSLGIPQRPEIEQLAAKPKAKEK